MSVRALAAFLVVAALGVWTVASGFLVNLYMQVLAEPWAALTAVGTLALAGATFATLWRDRNLLRLERTPNLVVRQGSIVHASGKRPDHEITALNDCQAVIEAYNLGKFPIYISRIRFVYFHADAIEKPLFVVRVGEAVGANEVKSIRVRLDVQQADAGLPSNSAAYVEFLHGATGPQEWKVMIPVGPSRTLPIELGPYQTLPTEAPRSDFYGDEYLFG